MDFRNSLQRRHLPTSPVMDATDESLADVDEPPELTPRPTWPSQLRATTFGKADPQMFTRRESLLTRQLHSETEHTDDDELSRAPPRALSTQSVWSNPSVASTAELTSDDGHSLASPAISPPLPPTAMRTIIPVTEKPLAKEPRIMGQEDKVTATGTEQSVEAGLGRKRCISFACGNKEKKPPTSQHTQPAKVSEPAPTPTSPPKRKCMLKFVCPTRAGAENKLEERPGTGSKRPVSPPPPVRRLSSKQEVVKVHRGSDSTVTHISPKSLRKTPVITTTVPTPTSATSGPRSSRHVSNDSDGSTEATRFHEFASSDDEPEEWVQESTCHRSRLTVSDTLHKENILRAACEEAEEEVVEEEEEDDDDDDDAEGDDGDDDDDLDDDNGDVEEEEESDEGFRTDDEEGFAESDSEGEESDEEWWRPGGMSTAATSIDHLDRHALAKRAENTLSSSIGSASSGRISPLRSVPRSRRKRNTDALNIRSRRGTHELPDSTDFVCGTLDEDRPLEQAFLNHLKQKEAAKHKARPQDIDPTFPTSDPDMDEEDDEDLEDPAESEREDLMHGELDELHGEHNARRRSSARPRTRSSHVSPHPPRHRSPAPAALKRHATGIARSPPPPPRRSMARSPPPRKLFGPSPRQSRSPAPTKRMPSPPSIRHGSPMMASAINTNVLASRPQPSHTASLPRDGFMFGKLSNLRIHDDDGSDTAAGNGSSRRRPKRGAIDIFKGLEKKRQRRKEKLYQKAAAKAAAKGEKVYKVKPGRGAERMREVGLELQRYHGKGGHILSL